MLLHYLDQLDELDVIDQYLHYSSALSLQSLFKVRRRDRYKNALRLLNSRYRNKNANFRGLINGMCRLTTCMYISAFFLSTIETTTIIVLSTFSLYPTCMLAITVTRFHKLKVFI